MEKHPPLRWKHRIIWVLTNNPKNFDWIISQRKRESETETDTHNKKVKNPSHVQLCLCSLERERERENWVRPASTISSPLQNFSTYPQFYTHFHTQKLHLFFSASSLSLFFLLGLWIVRDENVNLIWLGTKRLRISWLSRIWKPSGSLIQICVCKKNHFLKVMILNSITCNILFRCGVLITGISVCSVFTFWFEFVIADSSDWLQRKLNWTKERKK